MVLPNIIRKIRITALLLFLVPTIALLGTLLSHNLLASFNFSKDLNFKIENNNPGSYKNYLCNEENNFCQKLNFEEFDTLAECYPKIVDSHYESLDGKIIDQITVSKLIESKEKFYNKYVILDQFNHRCILNSDNIQLYNLFPSFFETIYNIKNSSKTNLGTSVAVNPFLYGETSISNIAKRYPIKFVFKSLLYIGVLIMLFYWIYYNRIFKNLLNSNKNNIFFIFGILSAIFLLLHVFFLGWIFESQFLTKLRRVFIIFFILFEILAQAFLIRKIFLTKDKIKNYIHYLVVYIKLFFVISIILFTLSILFVLFLYNLDSKIDYILEWNYFLILLLFYFLSFLMWKKIN
jgi:hypothetical protein